MPAVQQWGRKESFIWPPRGYIYTLGALFLAIVATGFFVWLRFQYGLPPLERYYLPYYLRTETAGLTHPASTYQMIFVSDGKLPDAGRSRSRRAKRVYARRAASRCRLCSRLKPEATASGISSANDHAATRTRRSMLGSRTGFTGTVRSTSSFRCSCCSGSWYSSCNSHCRFQRTFDGSKNCAMAAA